MTAETLTAPVSRKRGRIARTVTDSLVTTQRNLLQTTRIPETLFWMTVQPVMFVLLFAYVFGGAIPLPGGGSYKEYLMVGVMAQTVAFGGASTGVGLADDLQKGIVDRFRSLPMARSAPLIGRSLAELVRNTLILLVIAPVALLVGWRIHGTWPHAVEAYALLLLFAFTMSWIGILIGLSVPNPETANSAGLGWLFPVVFLSNAFVPLDGMPGWLRAIAGWNPVSTTVAACRSLFGNPNPIPPGAGFPLEHPVVTSVGWCALILAVVVPLAVRRYRNRLPH